MGEAKRRRQAKVRVTRIDDPQVRQLFENSGEVMTVALIGAGLIVPLVKSMPIKELMLPQHRLLRLAFGTLDRIRTGELAANCFLCAARHGWQGFSCYAVIERARGAEPDKKALVLPICHDCDSISTAETQRRIGEQLPLRPIVLEGTA